MVAINKDEKDAIRKRFPNTHIVRTMKQRSKRHRYYCEENKQVMRYLNELRGMPNSSKSGGVNRNRHKKNRKRVPA